MITDGKEEKVPALVSYHLVSKEGGLSLFFSACPERQHRKRLFLKSKGVSSQTWKKQTV